MRPTHDRLRFTIVTITLAVAALAGCDDDGGDEPRDIIVGDTRSDTAADTASPGDTSDTSEPDTADTTEPGDLGEDGLDTVDDTDDADAAETDVAGTCGDGLLDAGEVCDGSALSGQTCETQGFDSGTLTCSANCDNFVTTACVASPDCGNGQLDGSEACDGTALDAQTCQTQGFGGGTLACLASCTGFDTSGCTPLDLCGNDQLDGSEVCDGTALDGQDCASQGFDAGALGCAGDCTAFDTTQCTVATCGNGTLDAGEPCDDTELDGQTCLDLGFDAGTLSCSANCQLDDTGCTREVYPALGAVVIAQLMADPVQTDEWVELVNTGTSAVSINGCSLQDDTGTEQGLITGAPVLMPGDAVTLATPGATPGFTPDGTVSQLVLEETGADTLELVCESTVVDAVAWDDASFPDVTGASMQLDSDHLDATDNDDGANWCAGQTAYDVDLGTPGGPNDCPPTYTIDFCRLQFPVTIDAAPGTMHTVYGRLYVAGLTDQSTGNDPAVSLLAQLGVGPSNTDPANNASWVWDDAAPNPGWDGTTMGVPDEDEYQAVYEIPATATVGEMFDYAFRFSGDGGQTWTWCDSGGPGNTDGYQVANAGKLTVTAAP